MMARSKFWLISVMSWESLKKGTTTPEPRKNTNTLKPTSSDRWFTSDEKNTSLHQAFADPVINAKPCTYERKNYESCKPDTLDPKKLVPMFGGKKSRRKASKKSHRKSSTACLLARNNVNLDVLVNPDVDVVKYQYYI